MKSLNKNVFNLKGKRKRENWIYCWV